MPDPPILVFFLDFLSFLSAIFLAFSAFSFLPRIVGAARREKTLAFFVGFPCLFSKRQGLEVRDFKKLQQIGSIFDPNSSCCENFGVCPLVCVNLCCPWERKKPINIKNFGGTPPGLCPVCPGDMSHLSRDMSRLSRGHSVPLVLISPPSGPNVPGVPGTSRVCPWDASGASDRQIPLCDFSLSVFSLHSPYRFCTGGRGAMGSKSK